MSENNIIHNFEIKNEINNNIEDNDDQSFNKLLSLQLLIHKQSGLKDICK